MRICIVSAHYPPDPSGMGDYTHFLASALAVLGHEVHVITQCGDLDERLYPPPATLRVHRIVEGWTLRHLPGLIRAVRRIDPHALVLQYTPHAYDRRGLTLAVNLVPWLTRFATSARVVVNFHELFIPFDGTLKHFAAGAWQRLMAYLITPAAHGLMAISGDWPGGLRRVGVRREVSVIPVGSNIPRVHVRPEALREIRADLGACGDTMLVGCFGSAGPDRDTRQLREALRLAGAHVSLACVWVGNTGPRGTDDDWRGIPIRWTGYLAYPDLSRILSACDCVILPFSDGISTKRGTAPATLAHAVPLITTAPHYAAGPFLDGVNVRLVEPGDASALADALLQLARDPEVRTRLVSNGLALYRTRFEWSVIARETVRLLEPTTPVGLHRGESVRA